MIFVTATALLALWASDCCTANPHGEPNPSNGKRFIMQLTRNTKQSGFHSARNYKEDLEFVQNGYSMSIFVGNPPQEIKVELDTGSSDLWVQGNSYGYYCNGNHSEFVVKCSRQFEFLQDKYYNSYGKGKCYGRPGMDLVQVSGLRQYQYFGVVDRIVDGLYLGDSGGMLGLALLDSPYSFLKHLKLNKMLNRNVFSTKLTNNLLYNSIEFGGWDETIVRENKIHWIPIVHNDYGHWRFRVESMSIGSFEVISHPTDMVADTGASDINVHPDIFNQLKEYMRADTNPEGELCVRNKLNLQLKFNIRGMTYALDWEDFTSLDHFNDLCPILINILPFDWHEGLPKVMLGVPFLRKFYSIHDFGSPSQIAFVPYQ